MARHGVAVSDDNQLHAGTSHGYVHAPQVPQKTNLPLVIGTHQRDDNDISFLSLKAIHGIDGNLSAVGFEELFFHDQPTQQLHLCAVGRDDADVNPFVRNSLLANALEVLLQRV